MSSKIESFAFIHNGKGTANIAFKFLKENGYPDSYQIFDKLHKEGYIRAHRGAIWHSELDYLNNSLINLIQIKIIPDTKLARKLYKVYEEYEGYLLVRNT